MDCTGRTALVTGAGRGIGRGIALRLAEAGADVVVSDLAGGGGGLTYELSGRADLEETAKQVGERGVRCLAVPCDVRSADQVATLFERAREEIGPIDLLVNNAGVVHFAALADFEEERWNLLFDVNVKGVFLVTRAAIPDLVERGGSVVNVASVAGKRGYPGGTGYCASKFAVVGLTQALALELGPRGVRVNAVCPGILATHMWTHHLASEDRGGRATFDASVQSMIPLGREQTPEDVADAVLYLATAPNVAGVALNVAGGMEVW